MLIALTVAAALFQPPEAAAETAPPLQEICLTNACGPAHKMPANPASLREAVAAGNAKAVRDLGGTPAEAVTALLARVDARLAAGEIEGGAPQARALSDYIAEFGALSAGDSLAFGGADGMTNVPGGAEVVGSIIRRNADGSSTRIYLLGDGGGLITSDRPPPGLSR